MAPTPIVSGEEQIGVVAMAKGGETVVLNGKGGKNLGGQEHLAEGRINGWLIRKLQLDIEGFKGRSGGQTLSMFATRYVSNPTSKRRPLSPSPLAPKPAVASYSDATKN